MGTTSIERMGRGDGTKAREYIQAVLKEAADEGVFEEFLSADHNILLVAAEGGEPAGFLLAHRLDRIKDVRCKVLVYEIEVLEKFRRRGIGSKLMDEAQSIAGRFGAICVFGLTERSNSEAIGFYREAGAILDDEAVLFTIDTVP